MLGSGAAVLAAVTAAIVINSRLLAYGAALAPWFAQESRSAKLVIAWFVVDPVYLLAIQRFERDDPGLALRRAYFLGLAMVLYPVWVVGVGFGVVAGSVIPAGLELGAAAPLMMVGMLALAVDTGRKRAVAVLGLVLGAVGLGLPEHSLALIAAMVVFAVSMAFPGSARVEQGSAR
jgi:predicted branched-subunit amino acid permease